MVWVQADRLLLHHPYIPHHPSVNTSNKLSIQREEIISKSTSDSRWECRKRRREVAARQTDGEKSVFILSLTQL
jgi:hypothetical protein